MFCLYTQTPEFFNDICDVVRLFCDEKHIEQLSDEYEFHAGTIMRHFFLCEEEQWHTKIELVIEGKISVCEQSTKAITENKLLQKKLKKRFIKNTVYLLLKDQYKKILPWGSLTGIRPTKLMRGLINAEGAQKARDTFADVFDVTPQKIELATDIVNNQKKYIDNFSQNDLDIYVGIPFCVSRCKYCSFISRDILQSEQLKDAYMPALIHEIESMKDVLANYHIRAVYIGGGTPTALNHQDFEKLLDVIKRTFKNPMEFTVEAGRPDTITLEKLHLIKQSGANRISINAQTTNDRTLNEIGRKHTAKDFFDAFELAKNVGFESINTDMILGLPYETLNDIEKTLTDVTKFSPQNVTVHTLALKNSSEFVLKNQQGLPNAQQVMEMVEFSQDFLTNCGYDAYYLYRQKYMSGNLENVGYAFLQKECIYNIDIMEETLSIMAFGAGGISKRVFPTQNRIERAANVSDILHYIKRTDEMIQRKKDLFYD
ncbi:MAG: coproporphyrinogen dehydrogenase HemZ [Christensenellaceae bacterium]